MNEGVKALVFTGDHQQSFSLAVDLGKIGVKAESVDDQKNFFKKLLYDEIGLLIVDVDIESESVFSIEKYFILQPNISIICIGTDINDSIEYLKIGVDRYIKSPFENELMLANVSALLRTIHGVTKVNNETLVEDPFWKLVSEGWVLVAPNNTAINLTAREYRFIEILFKNQGKIVNKMDLIKHVIGRNYDTSNHRLNLMITRLRKKIQSITNIDFPIKTEYTVGYSFTSPAVIE